MNLFVLCSHGRRSAHGDQVTWGWCQGGRPVTLEDLGGEKVWWCEAHWSSSQRDGLCWKAQWAIPQSGRHKEILCRLTERILIPLPQMVAGESL